MFTIVDVSLNTDRRLYFTRRTPPIGALVHTTDGVNSLAYLQGGVLREGRIASANYLIGRNNEIWRLTPHTGAAYHAGVCRWNGKIDTMNRASHDLVGIELENYDRGTQVPTAFQHAALAALLLRLAHMYGWSPMCVYGHGGI